jgi:hypothetical protein
LLESGGIEFSLFLFSNFTSIFAPTLMSSGAAAFGAEAQGSGGSGFGASIAPKKEREKRETTSEQRKRFDGVYESEKKNSSIFFLLSLISSPKFLF